MKILIVGKYPPIEGGVSSSTFETINALLERGHEVHLLTNRTEIQPNFRMNLSSNDTTHYESGGSTNGSFFIHDSQSLKRNSYIPWSEPFFSKLFGIGLNLIEQHNFDLIFGWYFEPYGLVAAHLSEIANKPLIIRHAGSDLGKLALNESLQASYKWMMAKTSWVLTNKVSEQVSKKFQNLNLENKKIISLLLPRLPKWFLKKGEAMDWIDEHRETSNLIQTSWSNVPFLKEICSFKPKSIDDAITKIGIYGKIGEVKGSFDLLNALQKIIEKGVEFRLVGVIGGRPSELKKFFELLESYEEVKKRSSFLPFLSRIKIPAFIRMCDVVCSLERDFPVSFHGPVLAREVLSTGTTLLLSQEIAEKQPFFSNLVHGKNCRIVSNPKEGNLLANELINIIEDKEENRIIGIHGKYLSDTIEKFLVESNSTADALENIYSYHYVEEKNARN